MKILLLGDGRDDRGLQRGKAGDPMPQRQWGALHVLVAALLEQQGAQGYEFVFPLPPEAAQRDEKTKKALPPDRIWRRHADLFLSYTLRKYAQPGLMVIICDQDCDSGKQARLAKEVALAYRGLEQEPLQIVAFVSVECTESWLLCDGWPPDHRLCRGVSHPQHLGCRDRRNQAKGIFDQLHGGGHQVRTKTARDAVQTPASGGLVRMLQAGDFQRMEHGLKEAVTKLRSLIPR